MKIKNRITGYKKALHGTGVLIIALVCSVLCARPYLADRAPFSFAEAEEIVRVENRSVFVFPEMALNHTAGQGAAIAADCETVAAPKVEPTDLHALFVQYCHL